MHRWDQGGLAQTVSERAFLLHQEVRRLESEDDYEEVLAEELLGGGEGARENRVAKASPASAIVTGSMKV